MVARKHLFAKGKGDLGRTDIVQHQIHTGDQQTALRCWPTGSPMPLTVREGTCHVSGRYNTSLGLYGIYCQGEVETNIAHTALDKLLYLT